LDHEQKDLPVGFEGSWVSLLLSSLTLYSLIFLANTWMMSYLPHWKQMFIPLLKLDVGQLQNKWGRGAI
jgi:hypothetical protein